MGNLRPDSPDRPELDGLNFTLMDFCGDGEVEGGADGDGLIGAGITLSFRVRSQETPGIP